MDHQPPALARRTLLALLGIGAVAACSSPTAAPKDGDVETVTYGDDPSQLFEVTRPDGASRGVVVVIHGGFWLDQYDLSLGRPLAASLAEHGWTAVNLEYRRLGSGGGWPATFDDVATGIDALSGVDGLDTSTVITLGHSAGGHLAVWAAGRDLLDNPDWNQPVVPVTAAVSQAGVLDLRRAIAEDLGGGAVQALVGGEPEGPTLTARYRDADPAERIPLAVPVRCVHGRDDATVPLDQSTGYVEQARSAGADAEVTEVDGDHFVVIDPGSEAWSTTLTLLDQL